LHFEAAWRKGAARYLAYASFITYGEAKGSSDERTTQGQMCTGG